MTLFNFLRRPALAGWLLAEAVFLLWLGFDSDANGFDGSAAMIYGAFYAVCAATFVYSLFAVRSALVWPARFAAAVIALVHFAFAAWLVVDAGTAAQTLLMLPAAGVAALIGLAALTSRQPSTANPVLERLNTLPKQAPAGLQRAP